MTRFRKSGPQILITMAEYEAAVLESLVEQLVGLLEGEQLSALADDPFAKWEAELAPPTGLDPSDPVIARLFPAAYRGDDEAEAEYRRFTEAAHRRTKLDQAAIVLNALRESDGGKHPVVVRLLDGESWLRTVNAVRISLSVRLEIERAEDVDEFEHLTEDDPRSYLFSMYEWLGYLLESLLEKLR